MTVAGVKQLHWTQRIALVRHNIHSASRSGNFSFFKALQASGLMEGTNHAATLSSILDDDADGTRAALDNINASLALAHQDTFEKVQSSLVRNIDNDNDKELKSRVCTDIAAQKDANENAIDRLVNSAIALINQSPVEAQDAAANVWITGVTIISDSIEVTLQEMEALEYKIDDSTRIEQSWDTVKASVVSAIAGLKGVYSLMDPTDPPSEPPVERQTRTSSIASASSSVFRRLSTAFQSQGGYNKPLNLSTPTSPTSPTSPVTPPKPTYHTPNYSRVNLTSTCPTRMPMGPGFEFHRLSPPPATPKDEAPDPFDRSGSPPPPVPVLSISPISFDRRTLNEMMA